MSDPEAPGARKYEIKSSITTPDDYAVGGSSSGAAYTDSAQLLRRMEPSSAPLDKKVYDDEAGMIPVMLEAYLEKHGLM